MDEFHFCSEQKCFLKVRWNADLEEIKAVDRKFQVPPYTTEVQLRVVFRYPCGASL
jgi:hypothetical protein